MSLEEQQTVGGETDEKVEETTSNSSDVEKGGVTPSDTSNKPSENEEDDSDDDVGLQRQDSQMSPMLLKGKGEVPSFPGIVNESMASGGGNSFIAPSPNGSSKYESKYPPVLGLLNPRRRKYSELIDDILWTRDFVVPEETALELCDDVSAVLKEEKSLLDVRVETPEESVCCIGDIHGQMSDIRSSLFRLDADNPNPNRKYVFLGDYVDRGQNSVEVITLLFALKVEFPDRIFLLRGNHEESTTSRIYGFLFEVRTKYGKIDLWTKVNSTFCDIPLAALVTVGTEHRFLCVHGGLSPKLENVEDIASISRQDYGGILDTESAAIVDGLLWSDPTDNTMDFANNERGCGYLFGASATASFCTENKIDFICRAHQIAMEGYCWTHSGRCLTLFSAPNYCGMNNNLAALLLVDFEWNLKFIQYDAATEDYPESGPGSPSGGAPKEADDGSDGSDGDDDVPALPGTEKPRNPQNLEYFGDDP